MHEMHTEAALIDECRHQKRILYVSFTHHRVKFLIDLCRIKQSRLVEIVSRMSTFIFTTGLISPIFPESVKYHGITMRGRSCALKRWPLKVPISSFGNKVSENLGFVRRAGTVYGKELRVCWCQKGSTDLGSEENDFSEGDSSQDVESEVGSSSQVIDLMHIVVSCVGHQDITLFS